MGISYSWCYKITKNSNALKNKFFNFNFSIYFFAISNNKLTRILQNTDDAVVKKYATPRQAYVMSDAKIARAKAMLARGYTQQEIASQLGVPTSTLNDSLSR